MLADRGSKPISSLLSAASGSGNCGMSRKNRPPSVCTMRNAGLWISTHSNRQSCKLRSSSTLISFNTYLRVFIALSVWTNNHASPAAPPDLIAEIAGMRLPQYAWVSNREFLVWSIDLWDPGYGPIFMYNMDTHTMTEMKNWTSMKGLRPMAVTFSGGIGAWLQPSMGGTISKLCWMRIDKRDVRSVALEGGGDWLKPIWTTRGAKRSLVTISAGSLGAALCEYEPGKKALTAVVRLASRTSGETDISSLVHIIGTLQSGTIVGAAQGPGDTPEVSVVEIELAHHKVHTNRRLVRLPSDLEFEEATLCGDKIVWMLKKRGTPHGYKYPVATGDFQLWASNLVGSEFSIAAVIPGARSAQDNSSLVSWPDGLQSKPDGTAVTYVQGASIFVVPIK